MRYPNEIPDLAEESEPESGEEREETKMKQQATDEDTTTTEVKTPSTNKRTGFSSSKTSSPSKGKHSMPKPLQGIKRMRSASQQRKQPSPRFSPNSSQVARFGRPSEQIQPLAGTQRKTQTSSTSQGQGQGESQAPHTLSGTQAPRKKQRRYSPTSPPSPSAKVESRKYYRGADGELYSLRVSSTRGDVGDGGGDGGVGDKRDERNDGGERSAPWLGNSDFYDET